MIIYCQAESENKNHSISEKKKKNNLLASLPEDSVPSREVELQP